MAIAKSKLEKAKKIASKLKSKKKSSTARYESQGQNPPQSKAWTESADEGVSAKPIGWRWTSLGAKRLGKKETSKPSGADVEKYKNKTFSLKGESHKYLYSEKRVDKSDKVRSAKFEEGGMMAKGGVVTDLRVLNQIAKKYDLKFDKKYKYYIGDAYENNKGESLPSYFTLGDRIFKLEYYSGSFNPYLVEIDASRMVYNKKTNEPAFLNYPNPKWDKDKYYTKESINNGGMMAKGGATFGGRQYDPYNKDMDGQKIGKPIGYRFTDRLAKRLGRNPHSRPTQAEVDKYLGRGIYFENRQDKSDAKPSAKFISLAKGGATFGGRQYDPYNKDMDGQRIGKPIGYRFTDKLAKRLGRNPHSRPTQAEVDKYLGRGIYFENRQDKSDAKPSAKFISLAKGGATFGGRQYDPYNKDMDGQRMGKPVGYRFTDKLAKRLGKSVYSKPNSSEIQKYLGRGVYFENRQDKSDLKPSKNYISLEHGGMARGGVERISNAESRTYTENMIPFKANNLEGKTLDNGDYVVLSYGYYPIWWYCKAEGKWYGNSTKYSVTTSKHMSQSRPTYDATMLSRNDLEQAMMKHNARFEDGGMIDAVMMSGNTVGGTTFSNVDLTPQMDMTNPAF